MFDLKTVDRIQTYNPNFSSQSELKKKRKSLFTVPSSYSESVNTKQRFLFINPKLRIFHISKKKKIPQAY